MSFGLLAPRSDAAAAAAGGAVPGGVGLWSPTLSQTLGWFWLRAHLLVCRD